MEAYFHFISYATGVVVFATLYLLVREPLRRAGRITHLQWLLAIHLLRYFGLTALLPGVFDLGRAGFSHAYLAQVAWGDFAACVLAILSVHALRTGWKHGIALTWCFNVLGSLDYLNAGASITPKIHDPNLIGPFGWYIFTVFLPAWLVSHVMIFVVLRQRSDDTSPAARADRTLASAQRAS